MRALLRLWPSGVLVAAAIVGSLFVSHDTNLLGRGAGEDISDEERPSAEANAALVLAIVADDDEIAPIQDLPRSQVATEPTNIPPFALTQAPVDANVTAAPNLPAEKTSPRRTRIKGRGAKARAQKLQALGLHKDARQGKGKKTDSQKPTKKNPEKPTAAKGTITVVVPTLQPTNAPLNAVAPISITPTPSTNAGPLVGGIAGAGSVITTPVAIPLVVSRPSTATVDLMTRTLRIQATDAPSMTTVVLVYQGANILRVGYYVISSSTAGSIGRFPVGDVARVEFHGGTGDDIFSAAGIGVPVTALGNDGDDTITGVSGRNSLDAGNGDDTITAVGPGSFYGQGGDDRITTGDGVDYIDGGAGNDMITGGADNDTMTGHTGADGLHGGLGDDSLDGGPGADRLDGGPGVDTLRGGEESDVILGRAGDDIIEGGVGDDTLLGGSDADTIRGGPGREPSTESRVMTRSLEMREATRSLVRRASIPSTVARERTVSTAVLTPIR